MADLAAMRQGPLDSLAEATQACAAAELALVPPATRLVLRGRPDAMIAAGQSFGVALPDTCRAAVAATRAVLWLGPDEWLLLAENDAPAVIGQISRALAQVSHTLVDVSHRSAALTVTGPQTSVLLNHGCPLDLSQATFPVGMCTRTLFGKAGIILWRTAEETFRLEIERSFAAYVWQLLVEARREFITS
jgi:sarcosine oxidase, subunit gamma